MGQYYIQESGNTNFIKIYKHRRNMPWFNLWRISLWVKYDKREKPTEERQGFGQIWLLKLFCQRSHWKLKKSIFVICHL